MCAGGEKRDLTGSDRVSGSGEMGMRWGVPENMTGFYGIGITGACVLAGFWEMRAGFYGREKDVFERVCWDIVEDRYDWDVLFMSDTWVIWN